MRDFIYYTLALGIMTSGKDFIERVLFHKLKSHSPSLEILKDWIDLIDDNGWVAREQILGEEARSKVCTFIYYPTVFMC